MKIIIGLLCIGLFWGNISNCIGQEDLLALTKKVNQSIDRNNGKSLYIKYIQTSVPNNAWESPLSVEVELKRKGDKQSMQSSHMAFFADKEKAYVVYKGAKKIFVMKDVEEAKAKMRGAYIQEVLEMLWNSAQISEQPASSQGLRKLKIIPSEKMQKMMQVRQLDLEFDAASLLMKHTVLHMEKNASVKRIEFKYLQIDKSATFSMFSKAQQQIFDSNKKLLKKYQGFSLEEA